MSELDRNLAKLDGYLARFRDRGILNQIAGQAEPAASGKIFETHSPVDESLICSVARSDDEDVDRAAKAAKEAFPAWRNLPSAERRQVLHRIADAIVERAEEIAFCECWDTGQALRFMSKAALRGAENFRFFADRGAGSAGRADAALADADERHHPRADRPGRRDHALEHALHALHLEDRAGAGGGLHGGAQTGRELSPITARSWSRSPRRQACRPACLNVVNGSARRPARR